MTTYGNANVQTENVNGVVAQAPVLSVMVKENASSVAGSVYVSYAKEIGCAESARIATCRDGIAWQPLLELTRVRSTRQLTIRICPRVPARSFSAASLDSVLDDCWGGLA